MKKSYSSDIMINWNDMRTQFRYNLLYDILLGALALRSNNQFEPMAIWEMNNA